MASWASAPDFAQTGWAVSLLVNRSAFKIEICFDGALIRVTNYMNNQQGLSR
jgi:hypothetical protein